VKVLAGNPLLMGFSSGPLDTPLEDPGGLAVTPQGDLLVSAGHGLLQVTAPAPAGAPVVTVAPQAAAVGDVALFTAEASGRAPLTYAWRMQRSGAAPVALDGATHAYLAHPVSAGDDGTTFQVTVTDGEGNRATSNSASLKAIQ
jgi:hypothetical protein